MNRDEWLKERRNHLGASDAAAVLGLDPFRSPIDVWVEKVHPELLDEQENDFLEFGHDVEPAIERRYERETQRTVYHPEPAIVVHPRYPELACTPDGLSDTPDAIVVEYKFQKWSDTFGAEGSDEIPDNYLTQVCHQMACTNRERADVAVMPGAPPIRVYRAYRDRELENQLIDRLRAWWADHVVKGIEPAIDASAGWSSYLAKKYPVSKGEIVKCDDPTTISYVKSYSQVCAEIEKWEQLKEHNKNSIKAFIGENDGLVTPDGTKITWRKSKDTVEDVVNWCHLAAMVADEYQVTEDDWKRALLACTTKGVVTRKGTRKFLISEAKHGK